MKTSELEGSELDRAVAKAIGKEWRKPNHGTCCTCQTCGWDHDDCQCGYHEDWQQGGPLIEEYGISVNPDAAGDWYKATMWDHTAIGEAMIGEEGAGYLIAAMRCLVASKYGDEVVY